MTPLLTVKELKSFIYEGPAYYQIGTYQQELTLDNDKFTITVNRAVVHVADRPIDAVHHWNLLLAEVDPGWTDTVKILRTAELLLDAGHPPMNRSIVRDVLAEAGDDPEYAVEAYTQLMASRAANTCDCICHRPGYQVLHCFPCC